MAYDGQLVFDTTIDTKGFQQGTSRLGDLVKGGVINDALRGLFNFVVGQIDAAMNRLDTFDQFNEVMTVLLGSTEKANKALNDTNDIVLGTAFGLDTAAQSVQAFVSAGMDVSKATDTMQAWADATAFYTIGANEDLESVSKALQRMELKGNVTMEHMQMILERGIPAIDIYADAVGMSTAEVTEQMSKGELKADDFIKVMNKAFATGTTRFPAIAGAAKQAGSSWAGSIDNMKAAVARGIGSVLENFDKMFNLKAGMVKFGKAIEQVLKFIGENLEWILPIVGGVVSAFLAWNYVVPAIQVVSAAVRAASVEAGIFAEMMAMTNGAVAANASVLSTQSILIGLLTGQISLKTAVTAIATKVQEAWNRAIAANPIGIAIVLAIAFAAAIVAITNALRESNESYVEHRENIDSINNATDSLVSSLDQSEDAYKKNAAELNSSAIQAGRAVTSLKALYKEYQENGQGADRLNDEIKQLNEIYPDLNLQLDEETKLLNMSTQELDKYIDLKKKQASTQAINDRENELLREQADIQGQLEEMALEIQAIQEDENLTWMDKMDLISKMKDSYDSLADAQESNARKLKAIGKSNQETISKEDEAWLKYQDVLHGATNEAGEDYKALANKYRLSNDEILKGIKGMEGDIDAYTAHLERSYTEAGHSIEEYAGKYHVSINEINAWMDEHNGNLQDWVDHQEEITTEAGLTVEQLAEKWGVTVKEIEQWCFENNKDIQDWSDMQDDALQDWQDSVEEHQEAVINDFEELPTELDVSLDDMIKVLNENADKYNHWKDLMVQASGKLSAGTLAKLRELGPGTSKILEDIINDTSGQKARELESAMGKAAAAGVAGAEAEFSGAYDVGMDAVDSMGSGIADNTTTAKQAAETSVVATLDTMSSSVFESQSKVKTAWETIKTTILVAFRPLIGEMKSVMEQVMQGMISKMDSMSGSLYAKATSIASGVLSRTKKAYDIHSPSKAMQDIYEMVMQGGWLGMDKKEGSLYRKSDEISEGVLQRLAGVPEGLAAAFSSDMLSTIGAMQSGIVRAQPIFGSPALAAAGGNVYETNVTFNEPVNQPDVIARRISQTQRYGLAGRRN